MKRWVRKDEWMELAACGGSEVHTADDPDEQQLAEAILVCAGCRVRPECIEWAVSDRACGVVVAGTYLPDPKLRRELKLLYIQLGSSLAGERELRGTDI